MTRNEKRLMGAAAVVAGGLLAAYFIDPNTMRRWKKALSDQAQERSGWYEGTLAQIEAQLTSIEKRLHEAAEGLGHRMAEAGQRTLDHHLPVSPPSPEQWKLSRSDVDRDLPHIPGS